MSADLQIREEIKRYLKGEMDSREAHAFEVKMLSDPFLSEAVEGWSKAEDVEYTRVWTPVRTLVGKKKSAASMPEMYRMVAGFALLVGMGALVWILTRPTINKDVTGMQSESSLKDPTMPSQNPKGIAPLVENTQTLTPPVFAEGSTLKEDISLKKNITLEESPTVSNESAGASGLEADNAGIPPSSNNSFSSDANVSSANPPSSAGSEKKTASVNPEQKWYSWVGGSSSATEPKSKNERTTEKSVSIASPIPDLIRSGNLVSAQQQLKSLNKKEIDPLLYLKYQAYLAWKSGNTREAKDWLKKIDKKFPGQTKGLPLTE
jgi:hypothetical protein